MNILLVEDDSVLCSLIKELMKGPEVNVLQAPTLAAMWEVLKKQRVDVILLDLDLPDSSPPETLSQIRPIKMQHPHTAVCVVTGQSQIQEADALKAGADDYLHKVNLFKPRNLLQVAASLVNKFSPSHAKLDTQMGLLKEATRQTIQDLQEE